jgi:Flp pilus assembly protein TadB
MAGEGRAVPLSEHEQRLLEQIERSLDEDRKLASAVRSTDPRLHARRRMIGAVIAVLLGLAVLIFGVAGKYPLLGVAGFVVMLGAAAWGIQAFRRGRRPELRVVKGTTRRTGRARRAGGARRGSMIDRLEDRWRNRHEGDF